MIEHEEWLRAEFGRTVTSVRPALDPLGRLLARQRRRRIGRWASAAMTFSVVALTGGAVALSGAPTPVVPPNPPDPVVNELLAVEITSQWTRDLLAAPTRGNLAGDRALIDDLTGRMIGQQQQWNTDPALDRVKVLLVAQVADVRIATVAYYNDTHAVAVRLSAPSNLPPSQLTSHEYGAATEGLDPFTIGGAQHEDRPASSYLTALAPPSCQIASSNLAQFTADGTVAQVWREHGDHVVEASADGDRWWRFTCGGVVRHVEVGFAGKARPVTSGRPTATERGAADPAHIARALDQWHALPGLPISRHRALWAGTLAGTTTPVVVIAGETPSGGVLICALVGTDEHPNLARAIPGRSLDFSGQLSVPDPGAAISTAVAPSPDLIAVRLPNQDHPFVLSDRLLVIAPPTATQLRISGGQSVPVVDGVAVITIPVPASRTLTAIDSRGATIAELTVAEPDADGMLFNQPLYRRW